MEVGAGQRRPGLAPARSASRRDALAEVGLADRADEWPAFVRRPAPAGGLARALVHQPRLAAGRTLRRAGCAHPAGHAGLIERLWLAHRCTTVLVTHDVGEAVNLADRVVLVENGQVAMDTPVPLARSRNPADLAFVALEHAILQRVLQGPNAQPASYAYACAGDSRFAIAVAL